MENTINKRVIIKQLIPQNERAMLVKFIRQNVSALRLEADFGNYSNLESEQIREKADKILEMIDYFID